jgi:hypothetical protein
VFVNSLECELYFQPQKLFTCVHCHTVFTFLTRSAAALVCGVTIGSFNLKDELPGSGSAQFFTLILSLYNVCKRVHHIILVGTHIHTASHQFDDHESSQVESHLFDGVGTSVLYLVYLGSSVLYQVNSGFSISTSIGVVSSIIVSFTSLSLGGFCLLLGVSFLGAASRIT